MPSPTSSGRVFHVVTDAAWQAQVAASAAVVAVEQFERHGFVHCCFREQLTEIATWWFDAGDALVALELDPAGLTAELRLEASPTRWYPHLYGPIDAAAVVAVHPVPRTGDRSAVLPSALQGPPPSGYQLTGIVDGAERTVRWCAEARLDGDATWRARADDAIAEGRTVELLGGIHVPATLDRAYESFALLCGVTDDGHVVRYDGDGFFPR
jgi:uncharacterized protein (DUF952 family)